MNNILVDRIPYVYLLNWENFNKSYIGVRYGKNCHPEDLFKTYFTSSKEVKKFINENGLPSTIKILKTFDNVVDAKNYEDYLLRENNAGSNHKFLNIKGDSFKNLDITKVNYKTGLNNPIHKVLATDEGRKQFSEKVSKGTKLANENPSEKHKLARLKNTTRLNSDKNPGKNPTLETRQKMSVAQKQRLIDFPEQTKFIGVNNPFYGTRGPFYTHSEEWREKQINNLKNHRNKEIYNCPLCKKIIKTTANWYKHLRKTHQISDDKIKSEFMKFRIIENN